MRNYVKLWANDWTDDLGPPAGLRWNSRFYNTADEAGADWQNISSTPDFLTGQPGYSVWFPIDKEQLREFFNAAAIAGWPLTGTSLLQATIGAFFINADGSNPSPRYGWIDGNGVERQPTPSDEGRPTMVCFRPSGKAV